MPELTRPALLQHLQRTLQAMPAVDAAWEGGSAAFGHDDGLSDIDTVAVVADEAIDGSFAQVEAALQALSPVTLRYDVPGTIGYAQKFFRLRDAGEFLVIDLCFIRRSDPLLFREVELHGRGHIWFDRRGVLVEAHLDTSADAAAAAARAPMLAAAFEMMQHVVTKERLRGHAVDALVFYHQLTWRPLVEALRLLHDPQRRVFGPRYTGRDLPADVCRRIEHLGYVRDLDDLALKHDEARRWMAQCSVQLRQHGPGSGLPTG